MNGSPRWPLSWKKSTTATPPGIDNTVITYAQPIFFVREQPFELLRVARPFSLVIADTGIRSSTAVAVAGVRERWQARAGPL